MKLRKNTQQIFRQISISRFKKIALAKNDKSRHVLANQPTQTVLFNIFIPHFALFFDSLPKTLCHKYQNDCSIL